MSSTKPLLPCLAAAAASGAVSLAEAAPHLPDDPPRPYWPAVRRAVRRTEPQHAGAPAPELSQGGQRVYWGDTAIGTLQPLYKASLPQEQQARIAYETFLTRFFDFLWDEGYCVVVEENNLEVTLFVPNKSPVSLDDAWTLFVAEAFSLAELRRTFLQVLNSVKLSRQGFSPPDLPPVTADHAIALLGLYHATVEQRYRDMQRKQTRMEGAKGAGERARLEKELTKNHANYDAAIRDMQDVISAPNESVRQKVLQISQNMTRTGRTQIGPRPDYMAGCITRAREVAERLAAGEYAQIRPLVTVDPAPYPARPAGDDVRQACYVCGAALGKNEGVEVSKLVVESPSQALQSSPHERRPRACPTCIQVSMLCPIKPTGEAVIVSLRRGDDGAYLYDDYLRQMVLGELNMIAGRYCQITCTERVERKDPLSEKLGQVQYAMLKVADLFPADSLRDHTIIVSVDGGEVDIPRRQAVALAGLLDLLALRPTNISASRRNLALFSSAVRSIQADRYHDAIYTMIGAFRRGDDLNGVARVRLDTLTGLIAATWEYELRHTEEGGRGMTTPHEHPEANDDLRKYRDVLALTGLLVPFIRKAQKDMQKRAKDPSTIKRELSKLIEHVEDKPQEFCYDLAQTLTPSGQFIPSVWMSSNQDTRTITQEAVELLKEAEADVSPEKSPPDDDVDAAEKTAETPGERPYYRLTVDTVEGVWLHLYKNRYSTRKESRDLAYQLKLSLYARFPSLISAQKNDREG